MSWELKRLKDVCSFDKNQGIYSNIPYIGLENIEPNTARLVSSLEEITGVKSSTFKFNEEHLLYGRLRPYLNKVFLPTFSGHCSTEIFPIKPNNKITREFLKYWFIHERTVIKINATCTGARMPRANMNAVMGFEIPVPPLATQQKIVAKLDVIFAEIDRAIVIAEANIMNAEALFQSYLTEVFESGSDDWNSYSLKQLGRVVTGNTPKTSDEVNYGNFISFVKPGDFMADGSIDLEKQKLSEVGMSKSRVVGERSALMVCIGATIGKCGYTDVEIVTNQQINSITPTSNFSHKFIYYQMLTHSFQNLVRDSSGQATMPIINKSKWESLPMKFPSLIEQMEIVNKFDNLRLETQSLKIGLINKIKQLTLLKNAILQQAFNGELVKD